MIDSFKNVKLLRKYTDAKQDENKSDSKENRHNNDDEYHYCIKNHLMGKMSLKKNKYDKKPNKKCNCCNILKFTNELSFKCIKCDETALKLLLKQLSKTLSIEVNDIVTNDITICFSYTKNNQFVLICLHLQFQILLQKPQLLHKNPHIHCCYYPRVENTDNNLKYYN